MSTIGLPRGTPVYFARLRSEQHQDAVTFLEPLGDHRSKVINTQGRIQSVPNKQLSRRRA